MAPKITLKMVWILLQYDINLFTFVRERERGEAKLNMLAHKRNNSYLNPYSSKNILIDLKCKK